MSRSYHSEGAIFVRQFESSVTGSCELKIGVIKATRKDDVNANGFAGIVIAFDRDLFPEETRENIVPKSPCVNKEGRHETAMMMSLQAFKELLAHIAQINMPLKDDETLLQWLEEQQN